MRAATTEPWPARSAYRLDWSLRTPILTMPSEIWAWAAGAPSSTAVSAGVGTFVSMWWTPFKRLDPEVLVHLVHVGVEGGVGDGVDHSAALHHVVAVGHGGGEPEVLFHEQDREPFGLRRPARPPVLRAEPRPQPLGRLVEQQQARPRAQDARDGQH